MNINDLTNFITYFICLSAATQKLTDMVKNWAPMQRMSDKVRRNFITLVSASIAGASALVIPPEGVRALSGLSQVQLFLLAAVLGSSGSGVWNDALSLLASFKDQQKNIVIKDTAR